MGETTAEVIARLGTPNRKNQDPDQSLTTYVYIGLVRNSSAAPVVPEAHIHFAEDSSGTLQVAGLNMHWNRTAFATRNPSSR
jgi:hypothetical protein